MIWHAGKPVQAKVQHEGLHAARWFEDRDERGTEVHWAWLHAKWDALCTRLEGEEKRGVYEAQD